MERLSNLIFSRNIILSYFSYNNNILKRHLMTTASRTEKALEQLKSNEYFEKYADKIAKVQQTSPEEFLSRVERIDNNSEKKTKEKVKSSLQDTKYSQLLHPKKPQINPDIDNDGTASGLDKIMKISLIEDKSRDEIETIWMKYHVEKKTEGCIAGVVPSDNYDEFQRNAETYPTFLFPLPRSQGYEFIMSQFGRCNSVHFTPLLFYQVHKENAPECLTITYFTELQQSKGIVLMRGEYDSKVIDLKEATCLINQLQLYYIRPTADKLEILKRFTKQPDQFKHMDLVKQIENLSL